MPDYLTTKELAELLRIKERKVYELVADGAIPVSRVTGKFLFPREVIDAWLRRHTELGGELAALKEHPPVVAGSHDPLLDWALRQSGAELATFFDGSSDGLARLAAGQAMAAGLHLADPDGTGWNVAAVRQRLAGEPVVLIEWAKRRQGLIVASGNPLGIARLADLAGRRFVPRQPGSGSQKLAERLFAAEPGLADRVTMADPPARSEADVAQAVAGGHADAGLGIEGAARAYRLGFVPLAQERYDLAVWRRDWFEPPLQRLIAFCRTPAFAAHAEEIGGYDLSGFGTVHHNGP
jgi:putative molybdopterin biosynthesis protein